MRSTAVAVGQELERVRLAGSTRDLRRKADTSVVSAADLAAEETIVAAITSHFPDDGLLAEEGSQRRGRSGYHWVIDPLDGTANFLAGACEYAVAVAVVGPDDQGAAVICLPAHGAVLHAAGQEQASIAGMPRPAADGGGSLLFGFGLASDPGERTRQYDRLRPWLALPADMREIGSASVSLSRVAAGTFDAYCELDLPAWDILPGLLLARATGCLVLAPRLPDLIAPQARHAIMVAGPRAADLARDWAATFGPGLGLCPG